MLPRDLQGEAAVLGTTLHRVGGAQFDRELDVAARTGDDLAVLEQFGVYALEEPGGPTRRICRDGEGHGVRRGSFVDLVLVHPTILRQDHAGPVVRGRDDLGVGGRGRPTHLLDEIQAEAVVDALLTGRHVLSTRDEVDRQAVAVAGDDRAVLRQDTADPVPDPGVAPRQCAGQRELDVERILLVGAGLVLILPDAAIRLDDDPREVGAGREQRVGADRRRRATWAGGRGRSRTRGGTR